MKNNELRLSSKTVFLYKKVKIKGARNSTDPTTETVRTICSTFITVNKVP